MACSWNLKMPCFFARILKSQPPKNLICPGRNLEFQPICFLVEFLDAQVQRRIREFHYAGEFRILQTYRNSLNFRKETGPKGLVHLLRHKSTPLTSAGTRNLIMLVEVVNHNRVCQWISQ
eukprot:TRINITY_DN9029_c1_g2_i1.p1 TRINITY_DN9029_c1_g2~~TRINITY_DN9029_c1_g2_i1.p1  ORF type:complete len:120 (-),score=9.55 TRINITY_DN9029_c1_g2_i1:192-551(-)